MFCFHVQQHSTKTFLNDALLGCIEDTPPSFTLHLLLQFFIFHPLPPSSLLLSPFFPSLLLPFFFFFLLITSTVIVF